MLDMLSNFSNHKATYTKKGGVEIIDFNNGTSTFAVQFTFLGNEFVFVTGDLGGAVYRVNHKISARHLLYDYPLTSTNYMSEKYYTELKTKFKSNMTNYSGSVMTASKCHEYYMLVLWLCAKQLKVELDPMDKGRFQ